MNKKTIISKISRQTGLSHAEVRLVYDAVIATALDEIRARKKVALPGLLTGKMIRRPARPARMMRIPKTGEMGMSREVPPRNVFKMKLITSAMRQVDGG